MYRFRLLAAVGLVAVWAAGHAAEPSKRPRVGTIPAPIADDEPGVGDDGQDADPPDDQDPQDEGRALPSEPAFRPPPTRRLPPGEEEPVLPPDASPPRSGPAEPASAAQPLPPG